MHERKRKKIAITSRGVTLSNQAGKTGCWCGKQHLLIGGVIPLRDGLWFDFQKINLLSFISCQEGNRELVFTAAVLTATPPATIKWQSLSDETKLERSPPWRTWSTGNLPWVFNVHKSDQPVWALDTPSDHTCWWCTSFALKWARQYRYSHPRTKEPCAVSLFEHPRSQKGTTLTSQWRQYQAGKCPADPARNPPSANRSPAPSDTTLIEKRGWRREAEVKGLSDLEPEFTQQRRALKNR